jgi:hypothetical protein
MARRGPQRQPRVDPRSHEPLWPRSFEEVRFEPARWLVWLVALASLLFGGRRLGKPGVAGLVWSFAPRTLKIAAVGFALAAAVVLAGAIAAITLLALQLG